MRARAGSSTALKDDSNMTRYHTNIRGNPHSDGAEKAPEMYSVDFIHRRNEWHRDQILRL